MKKTVKAVLILAIALTVLICALSSFFVVRENEYACTVRFSKIIRTVDEAGIYLKVPFIDSVRTFPRATMLYDITPSEVLTSDKQNMTVDCYVLWRIEDPKLFYQTLGNLSVAEQRLDALTYNALKNVMGTLAQADIINTENASGRNDIYAGIRSSVAALARSYGIDVVDVKIKRFDLPESNETAVYDRMISERRQMAAAYAADGELAASLIRNDMDMQVNIIVSNAEAEAARIVAEGEEEYMRILAEAYDTPDKQAFYEFMMALDALRASLSGEDKTVVLGPDSPLAQMLLGLR